MQPRFVRLLTAVSLLTVSHQLAVGSGSGPAMPMPVVEAETAQHRWLAKPVRETRLIDDMEQTNAWAHFGVGELGFTRDRSCDGVQALRLVSPTTTGAPSKTGRPFGECGAQRRVADEDWTGFNRLSFRVYPHLPGFKVISLLVKLHNAGATPVPDAYNREGLHFVLLRPDRWNHVVWEITPLARDRVTGVDLIYRLQGNEPTATNRVCFDFDQLELQRVEADHFEGWAVAPGRVAYSHSGYGLTGTKTALASDLRAGEFRVVDARTGRAVLKKAVREATGFGPAGVPFQVLDFTELSRPGDYRLETGGRRTPAFRVDDDPWRDSIWKTINFFYTERCGMAIPGIHDLCHADWQAQHSDRTLIINGGWHDAGDLSQGLVNTAESAYALFALAEVRATHDAPLAQRLTTEARWGLEWLLQTRFGDGARLTWATMDYWTDGVIGTFDDTWGDVRNSAFDNFLAAATEALGARMLAKTDPALAGRSLQAAREDWRFAMAQAPAVPNLELASAAALASLDLFRATREPAYADAAVQLARTILQCQQRERTDWAVPLVGFFYTDSKRSRLLHYNHRSHEQAPVVALAGLCDLLPDHADWMSWYSGVALYGEYLKRIARFNEPYGFLPASLYAVDESTDPRFVEQVRQGIAMSDRHYLRRFPVWFDFRGNCGTSLSQARGLSTAARLRRDTESLDLVRQQLEWVVGRNPFGQSLMFGEGHDYAPQYTALSGDLVGSLPVGIQTRENRDLPYWPVANCYNYKEVWVHPSARWLGVMVDVDAMTAKPVRKRAAAVQVRLAGHAGGDGSVDLQTTVTGQGQHRLALRVANLTVDPAPRPLTLRKGQAQTVTWNARVTSAKEPWLAVVVPDNDHSARQELAGGFGD